MCWSLTAIDKFKMYAKQFKEFAISLPRPIDHTCAGSTPVILWGLMRRKNDISDGDEHDEQHNYVWRNINLQMVFQGVARSIVHVEQFNSDFSMQWLNDDNERHNISTTNGNHKNIEHQRNGTNYRMPHKKVNRWLPAVTSRSRKFIGKKHFWIQYNSKPVIYFLYSGIKVHQCSSITSYRSMCKNGKIKNVSNIFRIF